MGHNRFRKERDIAAPLSEFVDGADYMMDMERDHLYQRRVRIDMDDSRWDENYVKFLGDLEDYFEAKFVEEEEEEDPNYALFLEHLRESGTGYMLDVSRGHGVDSPIIYEVEGDLYCAIKRRTRQSNHVRKERSLKVDGEVEIDPTAAMKRRFPMSNHITHIQKKRRLVADRVSKSDLQNSGFVDKAHSNVTNRQISRSKRSTYMQKEDSLDVRPPSSNHSTHIQKKRRLDTAGESKSGPQNSGFVDKVVSDVIEMGTPSSNETTYIQKEGTLDVRHSNSGMRNSGLVHEVLTNPADAIKTKAQSCRDPFLRELGSWNADEELHTGANSFGFGFNVDDTDLGNLISRKTSEPLQNTCVQKSTILDVDRRSMTGLLNSDLVDKVASDPLEVNGIGNPRSTQDACIGKEGRLDVDRQSKSGLENSGHTSQTDPSDAIKVKSTTSRQGSYVQVEGRLGVNRKIKLGQAPDETYKTFLASLKSNGESLTYEYGDHKQIHYEDADEYFVTETNSKTQPLETAVKSPTRTPIQPPKAAVRTPAATPAQPPQAALKPPTRTPIQPLKTAVEPSDVAPAQPPEAAVKQPTRTPIQLSEAVVIQLPEAALKPPTRSPSPPSPVPIAMVMPPTPSFKIPNDNPTQPTLSSTAIITTPKSPTPSSTAPITYLRQPSQLSIAPATTQRPPIPQSRAFINPSCKQNPTAHRNTLGYSNTSDQTHFNNEKNYRAAYSKLFRKLGKMLRQPYDQKEYDDLWSIFSTRKPVTLHRDSRSGGTQRTGRLGLSYFDQFKDFCDEMEKVKSDSHKVLNLLRMLRFYLEKLAYGKIPKPWLDDEFKSILPGSAETTVLAGC